MLIRMLILSVLSVFAASAALGQELFLPPPVDADHRPALLYGETNADGDETRLFLAFQRGDAWQRSLLATAGYVRLFQLDGGKMLIALGENAEQSRMHLVDLSAGTMQVLSGRRGFDPVGWEGPGQRIRHWPENDTAFIIQDSDSEETLEFITVEYGDMSSKADMIPTSRLSENWHSRLPIEIAANGQHFAWSERTGSSSEWPGAETFVIKTFHFNDRSVTTEDEGVVVRVAGDAERFWPPLTWSDFNELSYATVEPSTNPEVNQGVFRFMKVDVHTHQPEELFPAVLPLTRDGGRLYRDPAIRALVFEHTGDELQEFVLDAVSMTLFPREKDEGIALESESGMYQLVDGSRLIMNTEAPFELQGALRTRRTAHRAVAIRPAEEEAKLLVGVNDGDLEELVSGAGTFKPLAWIE